MNSILKSFSLGFLLRSFFSGVFFVISYYISACDPNRLEINDSVSFISSMILAALFVGVISYGIHRSLIYPFIEWFLNSKKGKELREDKPLISESAIEMLLWRWSESLERPSKFDLGNINAHLNTWADYIHLQFNSAICVALGVFSAGRVVPNCFLSILAISLFVAAFVSNWRSHSFIDYVVEAQQSKDNGSKEGSSSC